MNSLEGSIKKWEAIVAGEGYDEGKGNCPLCHEFHAIRGVSPWNCYGCPVRKATGKSGCEGTPYDQWEKYFRSISRAAIRPGPGRKVTDEITRALAQAELDFLRGLRKARDDKALTFATTEEGRR